MDMISRLPTAFLRARLDLIDKKLAALPIVCIGQHRNTPIVRAYYYEDGIRRKHEYAMSGSRGQELLSKWRSRSELINNRKIIKSLITSTNDLSSIDPYKVSTVFDERFWNNLGVVPNKKDPERMYEHKGIYMRSRGEVLIAQVLDSLNLQYKYEAVINIGDESYYPDFVVYLPEFRRCFIIEFLGMLDSKNYAYKNGIKIGNYMNCGMVINEDLILFCGTRSSMPSAESIADDIVALIQKYCRTYSSSPYIVI